MEPQGRQSGQSLTRARHTAPDDPTQSESRAQRSAAKEPFAHGTIVAKIGGSTFGSHDTTLEDLVALQRQGTRTVVVHGGGKVITEWLIRQGIRPRFVRGLRVTDAASLEVVVAVLTGVVNKSLISSLLALGGKAMGISGADGAMLRASIDDAELGLVGKVLSVSPEPIAAVLNAGYMPVIAPVAVQSSDEAGNEASLLNVNADTAAGEIAAAIGATQLVILTDVAGVLDSSRRLIPRLTERQARGLMRSNVVDGGMVPKLEACLTALEHVGLAQIVDGRRPGALLDALAGTAPGTRVG